MEAATTHAEIARSADVRASLPVLAETAALIGDPQVRNLGTIGGSLAHADPSADLPAVLLAVDGEIVLARAGGARTTKAKDFFTGLLTTTMQPDELMTAVRFPIPQGRTGAAYEKHAHPASRYAVVGVAAVVTLADDGTIESARVAITGAGTHVVRATGVENALAGKAPSAAALAGAAQSAPDGIDLRSDSQGPPEYKAQLVRVRTARALARAAQRAATA
jgi:carbon-monoxide dehydrogenase medium subunit